MRILLLVHGFNSLSQRLFVEFRDAGHEISVEFDINDDCLGEAVELFKPDVIIAPFLKRAIPEHIWRNHLCLIVHPGVIGDRGPSALDWAILKNEPTWGVTVLQAEAEMDAGPVWASVEFPMRPATKSSLYRNEVTDAAFKAATAALERLATHGTPPPPQPPKGDWQPPMKQVDRTIDWNRDDTQTVLRKIRSGDGVPGVKDTIDERTVFLHDAKETSELSGKPGELIAKSGPAICRATIDGAVWIGHMRDPNGPVPFKLPATHILGLETEGLPEIAIDTPQGYREIHYEEQGDIGYLHFDFYNGAMNTGRCQRLLAAYQKACRQETKVIVLMGGPDFWSNGMDLNALEGSDSPSDTSWENINAIDDLAEAIIRTETHLTVAALQGNAGAGGVFLARAADHVWLRDGVVLNPHYKDMGNLYGSEFWTYLLPKHSGEEKAKTITDDRLPMSGHEAVSLCLADAKLSSGREAFLDDVSNRAKALAQNGFADQLAQKIKIRHQDEQAKPLQSYRDEELDNMKRNFYGFDPSYHVARYNFVYKIPKSRTPVTLARHRDQRIKAISR